MVQPNYSPKIQNLLDRMTNADKDFRFMATNDLMGDLQHDNIRWDDESETKVTHQLVNLLMDKNGEVQNLAVKCLGFLVGRIKDDRRQLVIKSLCHMLKHESEQTRDIASIALKTTVIEVPFTKRMIDILNEDLCPNLLIAISNRHDVNVQLESLDILTELLIRVGSQMTSWHERIQAQLLSLLASDRSALRKRSMNALSHLMICCSDELFSSTMANLFEALVDLAPKSPEDAAARFLSDAKDCSSAKTVLQCIATVIRQTGHRSDSGQLEKAMAVIKSFTNVDDDELKECCLQAFEAYVRRCSIMVSSCLPDMINICLTNIAHDPNYNYDEYDMDDDAMDTDGEEDANESAEDYSDDDDLSWKVRRASAKCLEAMVSSRPDLINDFFVSIAPALVSRFKEREESVKADIMQTFVSLLKQIKQMVRNSKNVQPPVVKLNEMIPNIVNKSTSLVRSKSMRTRQIVFQMFIEITNIIPNVFANHMATVISGILFSFADKNSTSTMKIDALAFIQELFKTHDAPVFHPQVTVILPAVITSVGEQSYKIASEALSVLSQLICVIRPVNHPPMPDYESFLPLIYQKIHERMNKIDVDIEIKERAIACMGQFIATFGDKMTEQLPEALEMLHERLTSESTRLICIKALNKIAISKLDVSLETLFPRAFNSLAPFLRKNSRPLKIHTLSLIDNIVKRSSDLLDDQSAQSIIVSDVSDLISEDDLYVSQLALQMLTTVVQTHKAFHQIVPQHVLPKTLKLMHSPLLQGSALQATLQFLYTIVRSSFPGLDHKALLNKLVEPIYGGVKVHKQAFYSTAKAIATISVEDQEKLATVQQLIDDLKKYTEDESAQTFILLSIGELGKSTDLSGIPNLTDVILQAFNSSSEDVKSAGSFALGCLAIGNSQKFLPIILHEIESRTRRQYLFLHSLREVILAGNLNQLETVWKSLVNHCECQEEGTRNVVSECLGKLSLHNPTELLKRLLHYLKNDFRDKPLARSTIVAAVKFTISDQPQQVDNVLKQCIGEFLSTLQDSDLLVRRVALITLNSVAHHKPSLILDLLSQLLPLLYRETVVKPELIREVEMGPFKHQVDDGLDSRKAAFECMYTLLDTCKDQLDIMEFLTHVEEGLKDHYDIKMLTYLMLNKLASLSPSAVLRRMDRLISPIEEICRTKPKETAVKQEHEKQDELKRSALRAFDALKSIPNANKHPVLVGFYENLVQVDPELREMYASIHRDTTVGDNLKSGMSAHNAHSMDES